MPRAAAKPARARTERPREAPGQLVEPQSSQRSRSCDYGSRAGTPGTVGITAAISAEYAMDGLSSTRELEYPEADKNGSRRRDRL
jgi:hypothetical protein